MKGFHLYDHHGLHVPLYPCLAVVVLFLLHDLRGLGALVRGLAVLQAGGLETPSRRTFYQLHAVHVQVRAVSKIYKAATTW